MLVNLTTGVNFTNILWEAFCAQAISAAFLYLHVGFVLLWQTKIGRKADLKLLVKLT
jgi:hypothetical protein